MSKLDLKPTHKPVQNFYSALAQFENLGVSHEGAVKSAINPNLKDAAVEEMLIQHLLTERLFRTVFNNADFSRRNIIAAEIEKVIDVTTRDSHDTIALSA